MNGRDSYVPLTQRLGGFSLHRRMPDKSRSSTASTSGVRLRQPGGDLTAPSQDVPGRVHITIVGDLAQKGRSRT